MTSTTGYFVFYQPLGYQASSEFLESQKHAGAHVDHSGGLVWIFPVIHLVSEGSIEQKYTDVDIIFRRSSSSYTI